jgi:hypothetical protein
VAATTSFGHGVANVVHSLHDLRSAMAEGKHPLVIDVRLKTSRQVDGRLVPGALLADLGCAGRTLHDVPLDRELVIYCNRPNEGHLCQRSQADDGQRVQPRACAAGRLGCGKTTNAFRNTGRCASRKPDATCRKLPMFAAASSG